MPPIRCSARSRWSRRAISPMRWRERDGAFGAAVDPALLARLDLERGARVTVGARHDRAARDPQDRARQARRRHRLRPAPADQRGGAARDRPRAARQPRALALPAAPACRRCQRPRRGRGRRRLGDATARRRLGGAHARQCLARARPQHRALHAVSHAGRPDRAAGRRRRCRERREALSRSPPRGDRDPEVARRDRRTRVRDLSHRGDAARSVGTAIGLVLGAAAAVRDLGRLRAT